MTKILRGYPAALTDGQTENEAPGVAEVVQVLAGRARALYELATGAGPNDDTSPGTSRNPQGLHGVDMSGPPWGSALLVPIATMHGFNDTGPSWTRTTGTPASQEAQRLTVGGSGSLVAKFDQTIWHKPFARGPGLQDPPLSRGYLAFRARQSAATAATLTLRVRVDDDDWQEGTAAMSASTTAASFRTTGTNAYLRLRPGPQRIRIEIVSSSTAVSTFIWALSIVQVAKRTH